MFSIKIHQTPKETILAVCDSEILGCKFSDGEKRIEVYRSFYGEKEIAEEKLEDYLAGATIVNLVGQRAVALAVRLGYVDPRRILTIGNTVHAQFALIGR